MQKKKKIKNNLDAYAKYSFIAFQMIAIIAGGSYGGVLLDKKFDINNNIFTIILTLFSVFIAMYVVIKQVIKNK